MAPSAACADCREHLGGYVLGALEPDEAEAVRLHIADCVACAREYQELAGLPGMLEMAGPQVELEKPPSTLEEAVLDRFAREHPSRKRRGQEPRMPFWNWLDAVRARLRRPLPAALAGAVVAAAITAAVLVLPASTRTSGNSETFQAALSGSPAARGATARAVLATSSTGTRVRLHVRNLRGDPDAVYELWCVRNDGWKMTAGTFRVGSSGRADVNLTTAAIPGEYDRLSVERHTAASGGPGQRVMGGMIQYGRS